MIPQRKDQLEYWYTEHLRMNGVYWGLTALFLMKRGDALPKSEVIDWVLSCQHKNGGFGAAPGHDPHMLSTVSAVQILALLDAFDELDKRAFGKEKVGECRFRYSPPNLHTTYASSQLLQVFRISQQDAFKAMNGVKKILASSTGLSMPCPYST
jgi:hypothetical protein